MKSVLVLGAVVVSIGCATGANAQAGAPVGHPAPGHWGKPLPDRPGAAPSPYRQNGLGFANHGQGGPAACPTCGHRLAPKVTIIAPR
jgi:hypothetical protein